MKIAVFYKKLLLVSLLALVLASSMATPTLANDDPPACKGLVQAHDVLHETPAHDNPQLHNQLHYLIHEKFECEHEDPH